jgi:phenylpropionate dioxygenase-like ring-hydroxylating dioxygenase large terminal subunit
MINRLSYDHIHDQKFFQAEQAKLFSKYWVYGCMWSEIKNPDQYIMINTPFGEVIISSDGSTPNAFYNKCMHRGHQLTSQKRGKGDLICPYHGWQYDNKGELIRPGALLNIPGDRKFYGVKKEAYKGKAIQTVHAIRVGDLVFINASENPWNINFQFDQNIIDGLELTREKLASTFLEVSLDLQFNWKLIFENLRDGLHPLYLHKETLNQEVDFSFTKNYKPSPKKKITNIKELSSFSRDGYIRETDALYKQKFEQIDDNNMYLNWLLFPYTHIASPDGGTLIGIENYVPISPTKTRLDLTLCTTKSLGQSSPIPILYQWLKKASIVFKEDFDALESIQINASQSNMLQHLGEYENQNLSIFEWMEREIYG